MIIYATMGGRGTELAAVSIDGTVKQRLALQQGQVRDRHGDRSANRRTARQPAVMAGRTFKCV